MKHYIIDKRKNHQQRYFICIDCKKRHDFETSEEYIEAVSMWNKRGGRCVGCYYKLTGELLY